VQVRGRRHSLDERNKRVHAMRLEPPEGASYSVADIVWDVETLRVLIQQMLERACVSTGSLIKAWDKSGDGELNLREARPPISPNVGRPVHQ
jgi:hypothetical protein